MVFKIHPRKELPHPVVSQFGDIDGLNNFETRYYRPLEFLQSKLDPLDDVIIKDVEADSNVDIEIGSLYNIISEYLKPEQKGRQVVGDLPQLRTILLTLHHKLKDQAKNIQRDKAKKYLEDCLLYFGEARYAFETSHKNAARF